jgi:hypothetical protein
MRRRARGFGMAGRRGSGRISTRKSSCESGTEERQAASGKREAGSAMREAQSGKRQAQSGKRGAERAEWEAERAEWEAASVWNRNLKVAA